MHRKLVQIAAAFGMLVSASKLAGGPVYEMWASTYTGPGQALDYTYTIQADAAGNSYVAGFVGDHDAIVVSYDSAGALRWTAINSPDGFNWLSWIDSVLDSEGNLILTGRGQSAARSDEITLAKYSSDGTQLWFKTIDGGVNSTDAGWSVLTDSANNIYVGAESTDDDGYRIALYKFLPNGDVDWRTTLPGYAPDYSTTEIALDKSGNIAIGASTADSFVLARIDPNGEILWHDEYESGGDADPLSDIAIDSRNNLIATVSSWSNENGIDYLTIKVDPDGNTLWQRRFDGRGSGRDVAWKLAVDSTDSVIVTGITEYDQLGYYAEWGTVKYSSDGTQQWIRTYSVESFYFIEDGPSGIVVDRDDNVFVGGTSFSKYTAYDLALVKYAPNGDELWTQRYDGPQQRSEVGGWLTLAPSGDIFLTGGSTYLESGLDIVVVRYSELRYGDMDCNGVVDFDDIDGFVLALIDGETYREAYPDCRAENGDIDGNGNVNFDDIDGFIDCLINSGCS